MLDHPQVKTRRKTVQRSLGLSGVSTPPINADAGVIKLTRKLLSTCLFCSPDTGRLPAIVLTYVPHTTPPTTPVMVTDVASILSFDPSTDPASGIVGESRLPNAGFRLA